MFKKSTTVKKLVMLLALSVSVSSYAQDLNSVINLTYQQQYAAADSAFAAMISADPGNGKLYYHSGENQLASYFMDTANVAFKPVAKNAIERFNEGVKANPNEALNYIGLGKVALLKKDNSTAEEYFSKAQSFLPIKKSKSSLSKTDQAEILMRIAEAYTQVGWKDSSFVFDLYRKAEALDSKNPDLFLYRGDYWFYTLNNGSKAAENYKRSKDFAPQSTRARIRLGQLYTRIRSYNDALTYYQEALEIDPSFAPAYLEMGFLYAKTRQSEESKKYFRQYLELTKNNIAARRRYANMLIQTEEYKEAIVQIRQILLSDSISYNDLNRALAYSYFEEKQYPDANYYINKFFTNSDPEKITSKDYMYFGRILMKNNQDSLGILKLMKAFERDSSNIDLLNEIASSYLRIKKFEQAALTYKEKIEKTNENSNDYYRMARAYFDAKLWIEADSALSRVNRLSPDFEPAYLFRARVYANLDPDTKEGLAKPHYEKLLEKAQMDQAKYQKDILEAYNYLGYFFLINKQYCESLSYWDKISVLDPANENAASALKDLKSHCPDFVPSNKP